MTVGADYTCPDCGSFCDASQVHLCLALKLNVTGEQLRDKFKELSRRPDATEEEDLIALVRWFLKKQGQIQ